MIGGLASRTSATHEPAAEPPRAVPEMHPSDSIWVCVGTACGATAADRPVPGYPRDMRSRSLVAVLLVLAVMLPTGVTAQSPSMGTSPQAIQLVPWEDARFAIRSVVPEGWQENGGGVFARVPSDIGRAMLVLQAAPVSVDEV